MARAAVKSVPNAFFNSRTSCRPGCATAALLSSFSSSATRCACRAAASAFCWEARHHCHPPKLPNSRKPARTAMAARWPAVTELIGDEVPLPRRCFGLLLGSAPALPSAEAAQQQKTGQDCDGRALALEEL